jgi:hypothetical protein
VEKDRAVLLRGASEGGRPALFFIFEFLSSDFWPEAGRKPAEYRPFGGGLVGGLAKKIRF